MYEIEIYNLVHSICCPHSSFHFVSLIDPRIKAFWKPWFSFPQLHCFDDFCGVCYLLEIVISKCLNLTEVTCDQPMNSAGRSAHTAGKIKKRISHCVLEGIFAHPSLSVSHAWLRIFTSVSPNNSHNDQSPLPQIAALKQHALQTRSNNEHIRGKLARLWLQKGKTKTV